jgi:hypothetical protein
VAEADVFMREEKLGTILLKAGPKFDLRELTKDTAILICYIFFGVNNKRLHRVAEFPPMTFSSH